MPNLNLQCPLCPAKYTITARYLDHADSHHPSSRRDYLCPVCPAQQYPSRYRRRALEQHLRSTHSETSALGIRCKDCSQMVLVDNVKRHLQRHAQQVFKFTCPHPHCNEVFNAANLNKKFSQVYLKHNREKHANDEYLPFQAQENEDNDDGIQDWQDDIGMPMEEDEDEDVNVEADTAAQLTKKFISLWLKQGFYNLLPECQLNKIISVMGDLVSNSSDHLLSQLKSALPPEHNAILEETFQKHDLLRNNFLDQRVSTAYGRRKVAESVTDMLPYHVVTSFPELQSSKRSEIYRVRLADIIEQQLERSQWDPDRRDGFLAEFDYIQNLRYAVIFVL